MDHELLKNFISKASRYGAFKNWHAPLQRQRNLDEPVKLPEVFRESALNQSKHEAAQYFKAALQKMLTPDGLRFHPAEASTVSSWGWGPATEDGDRKQSQHTCTRTKKKKKHSVKSHLQAALTTKLSFFAFILVGFQVFLFITLLSEWGRFLSRCWWNVFFNTSHRSRTLWLMLMILCSNGGHYQCNPRAGTSWEYLAVSFPLEKWSS